MKDVVQRGFEPFRHLSFFIRTSWKLGAGIGPASKGDAGHYPAMATAWKRRANRGCDQAAPIWGHIARPSIGVALMKVHLQPALIREATPRLG